MGEETAMMQSAMDRFNAGDPQALDDLLARTAQRLQRIGCRMLHGSFERVAAQEQTGNVTQEASVRLLQALADVKMLTTAEFFRTPIESDTMAIDPRLKQLLKSWEDLSAAEKTPTPEDHCRDCPELLEPFRQLLRQFEVLEPRGKPADDGKGAARGTVVEATSRAVRFRVDGDPLRGGMGEVFPARDEELGRSVALKFIQRGKGGSEAERRFRREVAITARLQHPGIVPVYSPEVSEDGRSGYAMRFIAGESFDAAIARHHAADVPEQMKPTRAELLDRFEAVCNTMAYAHSHGVIHRDLKPANVMLGKYGETFVVDWGLAKILADNPADEVSSEELTAMTAPREDSTGKAFTVTGQALGTLAYMPPEQAHGDYANLNQRGDVFALGAMLCKILTGQPPYIGKGIWQMVQDADLTACFARLDASGADAELIALAKRCLEKKATDRPSNAQAILGAVRAHKAAVEAQAREDRERLVAEQAKAAAEGELRVAAEAKAALEGEFRVVAEAKAAEERKRRRRTVALAASVVLILLVGGGGLWKWQEQRSLRQAEKTFQARQNRDNAESSLARLNDLYKRFLWDEADALLKRTETLVGTEGEADLRERLAEAKRNTAFIKRLDQIRQERRPIVNGTFVADDAPAKYRAAFQENGFDILNGDPVELVTKLTASPVRQYLLAALDDWAMGNWAITPPHRKEIMALTAAATGEEWRTQLSKVWDDGDKLIDLYDRIPDHERTPSIIYAVVWQLRVQRKNSRQRIEQGLRQYPGDFWLLNALGLMAQMDSDFDVGVGAYRAAVAIRPDSPLVHFALGNGLSGKKEYDAAIAEFQEAIRLAPTFALPHGGLGTVFYDKKEYDAAIAEFQEAIRLDPNDAPLHNWLGNVYQAKKDYHAAITEYREAIRLMPQLALPHSSLGDLLQAKKDYDAAIPEYQEAIRLNPYDARSHNNLGNVFSAKKEYDAAIPEYKEAIRLNPYDARPHNSLGNVFYSKMAYDAAITEYQEANRLDPNNASPHNNLGNIFYAKREYDAAIAEYQMAIRLAPKFALPHYSLGNVFYAKKEYDAAIAEYQEAIHLDPKAALPHNGLGNAFYEKKDYDRAIPEYQEAIRLDLKFALPHYNLGNYFSAKKQNDTAIAEYKEAIRLNPNDVLSRCRLGLVLFDKKEYDAAITEYKEAIRLNPKFAFLHISLGKVFYVLKDYDAAIAEYQMAIRLDPKDAQLHCNLGNVFNDKGDYDASITEYKEASYLAPKLPWLHNDLGNKLRARKDYDRAIAECKEAIYLDPKYAFAYASLGLVYRDVGRFAESVEAFRKAGQLLSGNARIQNDLRASQELLDLDQRLPAIRSGSEKPKTSVEAIRFSYLASQECKKEYALAFRLYTDAFAADPKLIAANRYNAACTAIQFAAGNDVRAKLDIDEWYHLQRQARTWLAADFEALRKLAVSNKPAEREQAQGILTHWLEDSDLLPARDPASLKAMPEDERKVWEALWTDVHEVLEKLNTPKK